MPYTPDPLDATQPTEDKLVESAAAEFRALKTRIAQVAAAAQSGSQAVGGVVIPTQTFTSSGSSNGRIDFADTVPAGWNAGPSSMLASFEFVSTNFFSANPNGHMAFILRCDTAVIATDTRGHGAVFGNVALAQEGTTTIPGMQIEVFNPDSATAGTRYLVPHSDLKMPLEDGVRYRVVIESVLTAWGTSKTRLAVSRAATPPERAAFDLLLDTGYVQIDGTLIDMSKSGFTMGYVEATNLTAWSVSIQNTRIVWGPAPLDAECNIDRFSRYGGSIEGAVDVLPVGTGNSSRIDLANSSNPYLAQQHLSLQMAGPNAVIEVKGLNGLTSPNLVFIHDGNIVGYFNGNGLNLTGASTALGVTAPTGLTSLGGTRAQAFWTAALNMESLATDLTIATLCGGNAATVTGATAETITKPLYGIISNLIALLQARKVI